MVPFGTTKVPLRPIFHMSSFLRRSAPVFEMRERFGDTDMLVRNNAQGAALAEVLAKSSVVLMRGHGYCVAAATIPVVVFRAYYTQVNAELQQRAIALGGGQVTYLTEEEAALSEKSNEAVIGRPWGLWKAKFAPSRREWKMKKVNLIVLLAAALAAAPLALAQTYPAKPIRLVVPFPPGGASDLTARTLAQEMGESMGQSIVVDNKPGANGAIGIDLVAKAPPDGYTILLTDRGSLAVNPSLYAKLTYDPLKDFSYIGIATDGPYVLVANPKLNVKTVQELVALAKSKPGTLNYSSFGIGSMAQLNLEAFNQKMGTNIVHVPYKGAAPAAQAASPAKSA